MAEVSSSFGAVYLLLATILLVFNMSVPSEIWMDGRVGVRQRARAMSGGDVKETRNVSLERQFTYLGSAQAAKSAKGAKRDY